MERWGNVRRNSLYGPGINVFNMSAAKSFWTPLGGNQRSSSVPMQQNVFNHKSSEHSGRTQSWVASAGAGTPYASSDTIYHRVTYRCA